MTACTELGDRHVAPLVATLMAAHPDLSIALVFTNRVVDLVEEGVDVAVRVAARLDTALTGRRLCTSRMVVVASPAYLERQGAPQSAEAVAEHAGLCFALGAWDIWQFAQGDSTRAVFPRTRLRSSSSESLRRAACDGAGLTLISTFLISEDLAAGRLVPVLLDWDVGSLGIHAVYPQRRHQPARLRMLMEALVTRLGHDPASDPFWPPAPAPNMLAATVSTPHAAHLAPIGHHRKA